MARGRPVWWRKVRFGFVLLLISSPAVLGQPETEAPEAALMRTQLPGYMSVIQGSRAYRKGFPTAAAEQWELAAKWGHKQAQLMLALLYFDGNGVEKDWSKAHAWLTLSSSRGDQLAIRNKDQLWEVMTPAEKRQAAQTFAGLQSRFGDAAVLDRLATWYRKERHRRRGSRPQQVIIPGTTNNLQVVGFEQKLGNLFFGEFFPAYDIHYRELQIIEPAVED